MGFRVRARGEQPFPAKRSFGEAQGQHRTDNLAECPIIDVAIDRIGDKILGVVEHFEAKFQHFGFAKAYVLQQLDIAAIHSGTVKQDKETSRSEIPFKEYFARAERFICSDGGPVQSQGYLITINTHPNAP